MAIVVDASIAVAWGFEDEATPYTEGVLDRVRSDGASVPSIWPLELANAVRTGERRGRIGAAQVLRFADLLGVLRINVDIVSPARALGPILELARENPPLSTYDASYLELALREGLALATLDVLLAEVAARLGIPLVP